MRANRERGPRRRGVGDEGGGRAAEAAHAGVVRDVRVAGVEDVALIRGVALDENGVEALDSEDECTGRAAQPRDPYCF